MRFALLPLLVFALAACDTTGPGTDLRDGLSVELAAIAADTPAYGGVAFGVIVPDGRYDLTVYTLGDAPEAADAIEARLADEIGEGGTVTVQARPATGNGSVALAEQVEAVVENPDALFYDEATGYVRVAFWTEFGARAAHLALTAAGVPLENVMLTVENRVTTP